MIDPRALVDDLRSWRIRSYPIIEEAADALTATLDERDRLRKALQTIEAAAFIDLAEVKAIARTALGLPEAPDV